jgi:hypothetical protein
VSQQELLKRVIRALDQAKIQYMITGSIVSSLQGEPRATHDIDIVVAIQKTRAQLLVQAFPPPDFYMEKESILDAIDRRQMFSLIDLKEGGKVDFWTLTDEPFDRSRFGRRYPEEFMGLKMLVSSPEDTILVKLRWANLSGGSEKQFTDALRVYEVQYEKLDIDYLECWAKKLDIELLWNRLKNEAEVA